MASLTISLTVMYLLFTESYCVSANWTTGDLVCYCMTYIFYKISLHFLAAERYIIILVIALQS